MSEVSTIFQFSSLLVAVIGVCIGYLAYRHQKKKRDIPEKTPRDEKDGRKLVRETTKISTDDFVHYKFKLKRGQRIRGHFSSEGFFSAYFFTQSSFRSFDNGYDAQELDGSEEVSYYEPQFEAPRTGTYYIVVQNDDEDEDIMVDVELYLN